MTSETCRCDKRHSPFHNHGYVPHSPIAPTPTRNTKRGPRSDFAFAQPDGVIPGLGDREPRLRSPSNYRTTA